MTRRGAPRFEGAFRKAIRLIEFAYKLPIEILHIIRRRRRSGLRASNKTAQAHPDPVDAMGAEEIGVTESIDGCDFVLFAIENNSFTTAYFTRSLSSLTLQPKKTRSASATRRRVFV
jgi:hypothetical protein